MLETLYAGGLRISELVGLSWADVIERDAKVQVSVVGKGGRTRQVLLPACRQRRLCSPCAAMPVPTIQSSPRTRAAGG